MSIKPLVLQTIFKHNMLSSGDRVLAAVSGGADSVCMLSVLNNLKNELKIELGCAHINHGLRGDAADNDEKFVKDFCTELKIPFYSKKADVTALAKQEGLTVEEAGRKVRYSFFEELKESYGYTKVATAHNKNDNAETVLMRIMRGTGVDGLKGIPFVRTDGVIRPILNVSRNEIEEYCQENNIKFCTDATNFDNEYTRNKIRNQLIPYIESEFNSKITDSLVRLAENAEEDSLFLNSYAERLYQRLCNPLPGKSPNALHIESFNMLDKGIRTRLLRIAAEKTVKDIHLEKCHLDNIFELISKNTGASVDLPKKLKVEICYGWLVFSCPDEVTNIPVDAGGFFTEVKTAQSVFIDAIGKNITLREEAVEGYYKCKINEVAVDLDSLGNQPLFLRSRRDGDRLVWFSDGRTKKIKNIFIDSKIPKSDRDKIPLLTTGTEVIAIVGSRVSEKYKLTKDSRRALVVEYGTVKE